MNATNYFIIGNISIPASWIACILAFTAAYFAVRLKYGKKLSALMADLFFYFIIVWKFSVVLTDFKTVIQFPLSILYFNGGNIGLLLGVVIASIKLIWEMKREKFVKQDLMAFLFGSIAVLGTYQLFSVFLNNSPLYLQLLTSIIVLLLLALTWFFIGKINNIESQIILLFFASQLFLSAFQPGGLLQTSLFVTGYIGIFFGVLFKFKNETGSEVID